METEVVNIASSFKRFRRRMRDRDAERERERETMCFLPLSKWNSYVVKLLCKTIKFLIRQSILKAIQPTLY